MKHLSFIITLLVLMLSASVLGQKPGQKLAIGYAIDDATNLGVGITDSLLTFKLLYPDSSVVDTRAIVNFKDWTLNGIRTTKFYVVLPKEGKYILYLAHPEYETVYRPINVKFHPKILNPELDTVRMRRIMKTDMKEVTVKATKLKFYFRKDTIVYNADVFMTQDGFMLDDILKKMPGLTFKNGEIFSNGRKIDALLLNGKDFFNKDRRTLLNNLPAYMVKNVVVYDKSKDPQSKYERERNFEGLVMDIKLKREYNQSTLGNMGIGVGTDRRYMGRAFGMKMHDLYRISAFAGSNNVGSNEQGGYNDFVSNTAGSDEKKNHFGGINYNVDEKDGKFSANGNLRIQGDKEQTINQESKELFFKEGNVFNYTSKDNRTRNFSVHSWHNFTLLQNTPWSFILTPSFAYTKSKLRSEDYQVSANRNISELLGTHWKDSIFTPHSCTALQRYGTSRMQTHSLRPYDENRQELKLQKRIRIGKTAEFAEISAYSYHNRQSSEASTLYNVQYYNNATQLPEHKRQYQDTYTDNWHWNTEAGYHMFAGSGHSFDYSLKYVGDRTESNDSYYNLDELDGWGPASVLPLGTLPSETELAAVMDKGNSKFYIQHEHTYTAEATYNTSFKNGFGLTATIAYDIRDRMMDYYQAENVSKTRKTLGTPRFHLTHNRQTGNKEKWGYNIIYKMESRLPSLLYMVEQRNDANILSVFQGNPNLKNVNIHQISGGLTWKPKPMGTHNLGVIHYYQRNPISMASLYEKETGRFTLTPMNVGFSRTTIPSLTTSVYLDKEYRNSITNRLSATLSESLGFSGTDMEEYTQEFSLRHSQLSEQFSYNFMSRNTKYRASASPFVTWMRSRSDRLGASGMDAWHFGMQLTAQTELPWSVRLNTEVSSISRRGYADKDMNDNEITWNLSATKAFKEKFTLKLEGYDLLNQRKNVKYAVTPQGRTVTVRNVLRRYAMAHFVWKFSVGKKKG